MKYRALAEGLIPVADAALKHLRETEGATRFRSEVEVAPALAYRPTLLGECHDKSLIAVEVNDGAFTAPLDTFVVECQRLGVPIRLFIAIPETAPEKQQLQLLRQARTRGIGVLLESKRRIERLLPAVHLSLFGLRPIPMTKFPSQLVSRLTQAEESFRSGDPAKGCGRVYDLIERRTRSVALEVQTRSLWKAGLSVKAKATEWYTKKGAWAKVLELISDSGDFEAMKRAKLPIEKALWARVQGLVPDRNDTGHEPSTREELQERDRQLRTRFEHAVDTLLALTRATPSITD
jgi:hypothetical protein